MKPPVTPTKKMIEIIHGFKITDNYRWLENNTTKAAKNWINAQNKFTDQIISPSLRSKIEREN